MGLRQIGAKSLPEKVKTSEFNALLAPEFRDSRPDRALLGSSKRTSHRERMDAPVPHDRFVFEGFCLDRHGGGLFRLD